MIFVTIVVCSAVLQTRQSNSEENIIKSQRAYVNVADTYLTFADNALSYQTDSAGLHDFYESNQMKTYISDLESAIHRMEELNKELFDEPYAPGWEEEALAFMKTCQTIGREDCIYTLSRIQFYKDIMEADLDVIKEQCGLQ